MKNLKDVRVLIYSPDSFGLSHFRRCRTIAHAIVDQYDCISVVLLSGSQIAGAFDLHPRVDFVKIPSMPKNSLRENDINNAQICADEISVMRKQIIQRTAEVFKPDIFITDNQPLGLNGELESTLQMLSPSRTITILGLCDTLNPPCTFQKNQSNYSPKGMVEDYYDRVWIYGPRHFLDIQNIDSELLNSPIYTGFLQSKQASNFPIRVHDIPENFILVTAGAGEDASSTMECVLAAREHHISNDYPLLMVLGPYMSSENKECIRKHASALANITVLDFDPNMEDLVNRATALVGTGGYNTFCEALSFDKRAMYLTGTHQRPENHVRASRAQLLGWCELLTSQTTSNPMKLAQMLNRLPEMQTPSIHMNNQDLDGLQSIGADIEHLLKMNAPAPKLGVNNSLAMPAIG